MFPQVRSLCHSCVKNGHGCFDIFPYQPAHTDREGWHLINLPLPREPQLKVHLLGRAYFTCATSALTNKNLGFHTLFIDLNLKPRLLFFCYKSENIFVSVLKPPKMKTSQIIKIQKPQLLIKDARNHEAEYILSQFLLHNYKQKS